MINADLANALDAKPGDVLTFYLYGRPREVRVARVVPTRGLAGVGTGAVARNAFFAPGTLEAAASEAGIEPHTFTFVSNVGGVEAGNQVSDAVTRKIVSVLGPLTATGTSVPHGSTS